MHYYKFHIGDYRRDTGHLSMLEHGIYRHLIDWHYLDESPIPLETQSVLRRLRLGSDDEKNLLNVLEDFFEKTPTGYIQRRVLVEIKDYHEQVAKNQSNGKLGGRPMKTQVVPSGLPDANPDESQNNPNHKPLTINHKPIIKDAKASLSGTRFPDCPQKDILNLWRDKFPHLTQPRVWAGMRATSLKNRWAQASKPSAYSPGYANQSDGLEWWTAFLSHVATGTSLPKGFESNGRVWRPDFAWVLKAENFAKIIDGKYDL